MFKNLHLNGIKIFASDIRVHLGVIYAGNIRDHFLIILLTFLRIYFNIKNTRGSQREKLFMGSRRYFRDLSRFFLMFLI